MKETPIKRHVATKIFILLLSGYIILTIVLTSLYTVKQYHTIKQEGFDTQQMILRALGPSLGQVTFDGDLDQLESLLHGIIKSPSIAGISYSDITKTMNVKLGFVPDYNSIEYKENNAKTGFHNIRKYEIDTFFGLSGNIIHNDSVVGNIVISSSQIIIFSKLKSVILTIILGTFVQAFLLWMFFRWVSVNYLGRRLTDIINGLNNLESTTGEFTPLKVDTNEQDEISAIQNSFNSMAKKLQTSHNKLITYNKELEEKVRERTAKLEKISVTDRLTGLYNRHKTDTVLEDEINRSGRSGSSFSLILIDIDNFKHINDTYGHQIGDKVLIEIATLLLNSTRNTDIIGRWGGEEFLIIASGTELEGALLVAESIRLSIEKHSFAEIGSLTISLGISTYTKGDTINHLISRADTALYISKTQGKNQVKYK